MSTDKKISFPLPFTTICHLLVHVLDLEVTELEGWINGHDPWNHNSCIRADIIKIQRVGHTTSLPWKYDCINLIDLNRVQGQSYDE